MKKMKQKPYNQLKITSTID